MKMTYEELHATHTYVVKFPRKGDLIAVRPNHIPKGEVLYFTLHRVDRDITIAPMNVFTPRVAQ